MNYFSLTMSRTLFKSVSTNAPGFLVSLLTTYVTITLTINPGIISYKPNISLICANGLIHAIQTITTKAPETIPLTAPARVKPFQ